MSAHDDERMVNANRTTTAGAATDGWPHRLRLAEWIAVRYNLPHPIECGLMRSYTNDVYLVTAASDRYVLKAYRPGWRDWGQVGYEADLARHLAAKGLAIAAPVAARDGEFVTALPYHDGTRAAVLSTYAAGDKPQPPFTTLLYREFGAAIARLHGLSDDFVSSYPRRALDPVLLIDEPLAAAAPFLTSVDHSYLARLASCLKEHLAAFAASGLDWGPIHGDASLDNLHVTTSGEIELYDLDSSGPGWRAADLQGWVVGEQANAAVGAAFRAGYSSIRCLPQVDWEAAPYLTVAWDIWGLKINLDYRILVQGEAKTREYLRSALAALRERRGIGFT